ncbi:hypothetical protein A4A49_54273 [Nicotiana attenuata]|uniref:Uncharacterized protein n=1 Tax=Nicotiana attenuata TaxID=49451 RepID=A0A314KT05_NICAT|nr:hypothetical protein A4A49_54273 [Nicotiana attenuata]
MHLSKTADLDADLDAGAEFLESNTALSAAQEARLMQMGATVRNASSYLEKLMMNEEKEALARKVMGKMSMEHEFFLKMSTIRNASSYGFCPEDLQLKVTRANGKFPVSIRA